METNKILTADVLDIIFEGRNKMYGAYDLRKTYNERLRNALLLTAIFFLLVVVTSVFANSHNKKTEGLINVRDIEMTTVEKKPEIPTPPPVRKEIVQPKPNQVRSVVPVIVTDDKAEKIESIPDDAIISDKTIVSNIKDAVVQAPIQETTSEVFEAPKLKEDNTVHVHVEREAEFPGGNEAWRRYVQKNMDGFNPAENGAAPGKYQVMVRFVVSKDGSISDVQAETNFGYGMEEKAINCIQKGPNWKPALQNGNNVNAYRRQPITFVVAEE